MAKNYCSEAYQKELDRYSYTDYFSSDSLKVQEVEAGIILPVQTDPAGRYHFGIGGVLDASHRLVSLSEHPCFLGKPRFGQGYEPNELSQSEQEVFFLGGFWAQWGHFLLEILSRIWVFNDKDCSNVKLAYISLDGSIMSENSDFVRLLELYGFSKENLILVKKPTQFKRVTVAQMSRTLGGYTTKEYQGIYERIYANLMKKTERESRAYPTYEKLYFSRTRFTGLTGRERGERALERIFRANGYQICYPEEMDLSEKIYLINHAKQLVSVSGTTAHQSLLRVASPMECEQMILLRDPSVNPIQQTINAQSKVPCVYVEACQLNYRAPSNLGPFLLEVNNYVKAFCKDYSLTLVKRSFKEKMQDFYDSLVFYTIVLGRKIKHLF